jgi:hypothetical protein
MLWAGIRNDWRYLLARLRHLPAFLRHLRYLWWRGVYRVARVVAVEAHIRAEMLKVREGFRG